MIDKEGAACWRDGKSKGREEGGDGGGGRKWVQGNITLHQQGRSWDEA